MDLHLDWEGFDFVDLGGQDMGRHRRILGEGGRKGNAVFAGCRIRAKYTMPFFWPALILTFSPREKGQQADAAGFLDECRASPGARIFR